MDNIFGSHLYYHVILIDDFSNPGVQSDNKKAVALYPNGYVSDQHGTPTYAFPVDGDFYSQS
jgi:hypothetical protein